MKAMRPIVGWAGLGPVSGSLEQKAALREQWLETFPEMRAFVEQQEIIAGVVRACGPNPPAPTA